MELIVKNSSSELSAKRPKHEASLDPLENIHSDVHELIFQHFKAEDSLRASLVSQQWNKSTEASLKCWEKLEIHINQMKIQEINRTIAEDFKSSRKYQKIFLRNIRDVSGVISLIRGRRWSSVRMKYVNCKLVLVKVILKIVEPTVETLHIEHSKFSSSPSNSSRPETFERVEDTRNLAYPKLKDLKLYNCEGLLLRDVTGDCVTLEKLVLHVELNSEEVSDPDGSFLSSLNKILENNDQMEKISLRVFTGAEPPTFPTFLTNNHQFKLKSLSLISPYGWLTGEDRLLSFLERQANDLEELKLDPCSDLNMLKTVLKMPKLMKVSISLHDELIADWNNVDFHRNPTIEIFKLNVYSGSNDNSNELLNKLFQSIPNCRQLNINCSNGANLRSLAQHCPRIMKLKVYDILEVENIDELPDLQVIEVFGHMFYSDRTLHNQILAKPAEARTRLEMLILQTTDYNETIDSDED